MITLHKLKVFIVVYDRGSFNQAAQELYMAQSAVSQHMQSLEAALGTPLFERSAKGVRPTRAGEMLYGYAQQMLRLLAEAEREIMQLDEVQARQLAVSATPGVSVYLLPVWLQQFQQMTPNVSVSLQTALTREVVEGVLHDKYDLGFLEGELEELDSEALGKMRFRDIEYYICVGARHQWAKEEEVSIHDLAKQPFINRQPGSRARRWFEALLSAQGVRLKNVAELDSPGAIKYALLNQMGVAVLPLYSIEREVERGEIHTIRFAEFELKRPLLLVWNRHQPFNVLQRAFITMLANDAPQLQIVL
jgi:DNA-binding transcriptional LysR family regulator